MSNKRSEANPAFCWNLKDIFESNEAWKSALNEASALIEDASGFAGKLGTDKASLKAGLESFYAAAERVERVYIYAMLYSSGDNGDEAAQNMVATATQIYVDFSAKTAFLSPEILTIDAEKLSSWLSDDDMTVYRHQIEDICRGREHTLGKSEETLLAMLGDAAETPRNAFDMFDSVDVRFANLENGKELTHALFGKYRESDNADERHDAFEKYFGEYKKYINTISALYAGSVKLDCYKAKVHRYSSALDAALFVNNVPTSLYKNLIESVHDGIPTLSRYLELRRKKLNLEKLNLYDLYVPLVSDIDSEMPYEQAKALVLDALKPLGDEYRSLLLRAFNEKWIDVYENEGKTTGAFSCGVYGVHPYVLLNYANKYDDAFTLAHELGHSMHSWFSARTQAYANNEYAIFVAEVASTVNEVLLTHHLLRTETDPRKRAYILNHLLEGFRTTVFRQTLFAEFEMRTHAMYEQGIPLTASSMNALYHELNETYYPACEGTDATDCEWARIPHFYRAFYVYQYATGFCSAVTIADRILNHDGAAQYLRFLTTGGSMYPIDELKIAGVDLTSPQPIIDALKIFDKTLNELESLLKN